MESKPRFPSANTRLQALFKAILFVACIAGLCLVCLGDRGANSLKVSGPKVTAHSPIALVSPGAGQDSPPGHSFQAFIHVETEGYLQALAVCDTALVFDVELPDRSHKVKAYSQPDGRLLWEKAYTEVYSHLPGPALYIHGDRLGLYASETSPSSSTIGLHVLDLNTGAKLHYTRESPLAAYGPYIVSQSGSKGNVYDMNQGTYLKEYTQAERLRFKAMIGDKVLYLRSWSTAQEYWSPLLLSLADGSESWTDRPFTAEELAFLRNETPSSSSLVTNGFPVLFQQRPRSSLPPATPLRFFLLTENGPCRFFSLQDFGLSGIHAGRETGVVDFQHAWSSGTNAVLVAGIASPLSAVMNYRSRLALVVFNAQGSILQRTEVPLNGEFVRYSGLDNRGRLLLVLSDQRVLAYDLPALGLRFEREYGGLSFGGRSMARMMGRELYAWGSYPSRPSGHCVISLTTEAGDLSAFYPFDRSLGNLADFKKTYLEAFNASHLFLCFIKDVKPAGRTEYRSTIVRIPRANKGWLEATLSAPPPVYTSSAVPVAFSPSFALLSTDGGSIAEETTWNTPPEPGIYILTLSVGAVTKEFPIQVEAKPVNKAPVADFILVDPSEEEMWRLEAHFDGSASHDPDGRIVKYEWSYSCEPHFGITAFGGSTPQASALLPGVCDYFSVSVTLKVTDDKGLASSKTRRIFPPVAQTVKRETDKKEFTAAIPPALDLAASAGYASYRIEVETGDMEGAGTNANVLLTLYGPKRADGMRCRSGSEWDLQGLPENFIAQFEKGKTDTFHRSGVALENVEYITLRHTNTGGRPGWHVKSLTVKNETTGKEWHFIIDQWLAFSEGPEHRTWYKFTPLEAIYSYGILFGGQRRSMGLLTASDNIFILPNSVSEFYFTMLDKSKPLKIFRSDVLVGSQESRGKGVLEPPYIKTEDWGIAYSASDIQSPTRFEVRQGPEGSEVESVVWVFPSNWTARQDLARKAVFFYPLQGSAQDVFGYANKAKKELEQIEPVSIEQALQPIINYGTQAMGIFDGTPDVTLGAITKQVARQAVENQIVAVTQSLGVNLALETIGTVENILTSLVNAAEWASQAEDVVSGTLGHIYSRPLLQNMAVQNPSFVATVAMMGKLPELVDDFNEGLEANDPDSCQIVLDQVRTLVLGNMSSVTTDQILSNQSGPSFYHIDYTSFGLNISYTSIWKDSHGQKHSDSVTLSTGFPLFLTLVLQLRLAVEEWGREGEDYAYAPYFRGMELYDLEDNLSSAVKKDATVEAMRTYRPIIENMLLAISGLVDALLLN